MPGRDVSSHSLVASCVQKPADEMMNSWRGVAVSWVTAKNGIGPKCTVVTYGFALKRVSKNR